MLTRMEGGLFSIFTIRDENGISSFEGQERVKFVKSLASVSYKIETDVDL